MAGISISVVHDTAFTQTAIAVLVTLELAVVLQARLLGAPASHPISSGARRIFAIFELYLTTMLSFLGVVLGYYLFQHLASGTHPLSPADRRVIGSLLLLLLTGLGLIALLNRVVAVAWKASESEYLEPALDDDLIPFLYPTIALAFAVATPVVLLSDQLEAAWLFILFFGLLAVCVVPVVSALGRRFDHRAASRLQARTMKWKANLADVVLPDEADPITIKVFTSPTRGKCLSIADASRLVRHLNAAWERVRRRNPHAELPPKLRLLLTRDFTFTVVALSLPGGGASRRASRWARRAPTGLPRGLASWTEGDGVPALPGGGEPGGEPGGGEPASHVTAPQPEAVPSWTAELRLADEPVAARLGPRLRGRPAAHAQGDGSQLPP